MSDEILNATAKFFKKGSTIPAYADSIELSREVASRRVKACVDAKLIKATGKEERPGKRGQRPVIYTAV